jgi:hypothetical protein
MNGFNGFDGQARIGGASGLRGGRQKGAGSYISSPNFSGKVEYFGFRGLNLGLSGYIGDTQSTLFSNTEEFNAFTKNKGGETSEVRCTGITLIWDTMFCEV